jgi:hypothetical protein
MILVDTNVLLDIATRDEIWFEWSARQLAPLIGNREAAINPVIYTELAPLYRDARDLDLNLVPPSDFRRLPLPYSCAVAAARAFQAYRKDGGTRNPPLPDFSSEPTPRRRV